MLKVLVTAALLAPAAARINEVWNQKQTEAAGIVWRGNHTTSPLPHEYMKTEDLPDAYDWRNIDGVNYCTMSRNQHIPQYCGSCWAHGSVSALGDRVKIARKAQGIDINLAVQHILNCGEIGSCHGGSVDGPYQWIHQLSQATGTGISYETSNPYMACSSESTEGFCSAAKWDCPADNMNTARTCSTFPPEGKCVGLTKYPNVTISEFGSIQGADAMAKEIHERGPISCGIDAGPILNYTGGVVSMAGDGIDHVISVVGWGSEGGSEYWIVRNSWGEFWGEMGYVRVAKGNNALHLEEQCAWAVVDTFTEHNYPCYEGGDNCQN
jgi:cathepsin X